MKNLTFLLLLLPLLSSAKSGNAIIPHYLTSSSTDTYLYISNTSNKEAKVQVSLFNEDGALLINDGKPF